MGDVYVGTCGYGYYHAPDGWKDKYETRLQAFTHDFELLEVNRTFYDLPRTSTCEKWRRRAAGDFTFTLKAWQALIHPISSPSGWPICARRWTWCTPWTRCGGTPLTWTGSPTCGCTG